jgi:hypothetical protein
MTIRPKYQVFISSTYNDLQKERAAVTWAVLSARHIPAGMENFSATDDRGWQTIKSVIDRSDYYVLILAGRYGSVDADGISWTEREYRYAKEIGVPILAFFRTKGSITADLMEENKDGAMKLKKFTKTVKENHLCQEWTTEESLVSAVVHALRNHIDDDEDAGHSRPGWYRGNQIAGPEALEEFARLSSENSRLQSELERFKQMTDSSTQLELVDHDDSPILEDAIISRTLFVPHPDITTLLDLNNHRRKIYYLPKMLICELNLGIRNVGTKLVEHVTIDLNLESVIGFECGWKGNEVAKAKSRLVSATVNSEVRATFPIFAEYRGPESLKGTSINHDF